MSKQQFKVGDRVRVVTEYPGIIKGNRCGKTGTIMYLDEYSSPFPYYVRLDGEDNPDRWILVNEVEHIKKKHPVIVITSDGKTTTATMREGKKVIKTATATCSDKDTFDYDEGARIAFERLQWRDPFAKEGKKPEYYNGKIVCIKSDVPPFWTPGKVYEIKDGWTKDNSGITPPRISSVDEINRELANYAKFIPLVED